jgi:hypothetical protein
LKVNILTTNNFISYYFFYPLLVNKRRLRDLSIDIKYYDRLKENIYDCDVILLDSKYFMSLWQDRGHVLSILERIRRECEKVIWLDSTASTGTTHFQVLPYVDKYWKKQLLKDLKLYENNYYGARIYTDFYKNCFNLDEEEVARVEPIKSEYAGKLSVSWNLGLGPYSANRRFSNFMRLLPWTVKEKFGFRNRIKMKSLTGSRKNLVCFRGSSSYTNTALSFQRIKMIEMLKDRGIDTEPVGYRKYAKELNNSQIAISPFGAGEICFRDYEIIILGTLLLKPSMDHLVTWPDIYVEGETYAAMKWDLSDFNERIDYFMRNQRIIREITLNAQEKYRYYFTPQGQEEFCSRFNELIKY